MARSKSLRIPKISTKVREQHTKVTSKDEQSFWVSSRGIVSIIILEFPILKELYHISMYKLLSKDCL